MAELADPQRRRKRLTARFLGVRRFTVGLCAPLEPEDQVVQSMPDVSPTRWHLAHTSWFFESFVLGAAVDGYEPFHPAFHHLFNSYYNTLGDPFPRPRRGVLTRPTVAEVMEYRRHVDRAVVNLLEEGTSDRVRSVVELGLNHEQQHQELLLTDIKHVLAQNPLDPAYVDDALTTEVGDSSGRGWVGFDGGVREVGRHPGAGFSYDNEGPRHEVLLRPFELADRLVTNAEYLEFVEQGGYRRPELWLSAGWDLVRGEGWSGPLYWRADADGTSEFTLRGRVSLDGRAPVAHVSYFEAEAFARWAGVRLPTEHEWEIAGSDVHLDGNLAESTRFAPASASSIEGQVNAPRQLYGDLWEWTASPYVPYPGYRPDSGALGEYNGKFMSGQYVLRGGSFATPRDHIRPTYRNFFPPEARWQFSGIRLARDV